MSLLELDNLRVNLNGRTLLDGVSLQVPPGGIVAVLGANGAGKTTLMRCISRLYPASGGRLAFAGEDLHRLASHQVVARGILQTPEGRQIFSSMTVLENLKVGAGILGLSQLDAVLTLFPRLGERLRQQAGSLSGGEQQMLCIGRALMRKPRILLMDEPSLGLAPRVVAEIFRLIQRLREQGLAILLVEQNARAALRIADHAAVLDHGRITFEGPAAQLAEDPRIIDAYLGGTAH